MPLVLALLPVFVHAQSARPAPVPDVVPLLSSRMPVCGLVTAPIARPGLAPSASASLPAPAAAPSVRIRCCYSLASLPPLYIVDGVLLADKQKLPVNPDDIERVEVLKGGPAAALYGSRAAGGVILITTKKAAARAPGKSKPDPLKESGALY